MATDNYIAQKYSEAGISSVSGLALSGANMSWNATTVNSEDDGILTSEEVELMTFPTLSLAVLSACESGLGVVNAEGVWGLQRSFKIAGADKLLVSLNNVDDQATKEFMTDFYTSLSNDTPIYDAYTSARKQLRNKYASLPQIWASFILVE